ncbi:MAG: DUF2791 family P-loop domain-containing protein [Gammaproteobacteria bacterium]|nr:DUF2791 family P-loop domain-containing protein [Gammaproteobacteria bacterium]
MRQGVAVRHPQYGDGVIVDVDSHRGAKVDFGYVATWVPLRDLELPDDVERSLEETLAPPPPTPAETHLPSLSADVVAARRAVLALKLGQVLEENVHELSVGTDDVRSEMEQAIIAAVRQQPQSVLVEGSWGSGKTHLLTLLTRLASEHGLATAMVILDGEGVTLSEPMGLMEAILGSLRYPGEVAPHGIGSRLADLRRRRNFADVWQSVGFRIAEAIYRIPLGALDEPDAMEVIEDYFMLALAPTRAREKLRRLHYRISLPPLKARGLDERPERFCDLLKGWAGFCALTGAKGLAVVFDEVDVEYATRFGGLRCSSLLEAFDDLLRESCPILLAFGSAPASDDVGDANDAVRDLAGSINGTRRIEAPRPSVEQTKELGVRLQELYARAYPRRTSGVEPQRVWRRIERFAEHHHDGTLDPAPRGFVRGTLELLDVMSDLEGNRVDRA